MKDIKRIFDEYKNFVEDEELENFWETLEEVAQYDDSELADARSEEDWGLSPLYQDDWYKYFSTPVKGVYYAYISSENCANGYTVLTKKDIKEIEQCY